MDRQQAIEIIRKEYLCVSRDCDIERSCGKCDLMMPSKEPILEAYKMAMDALAIPSAEPKWIPVGKESPVAFEKVLVTYRLHYDDSIHVGIGNTTSNVNGRYYWCLDEQDYKTWDILAWMPLPQPYRAESEDKG